MSRKSGPRARLGLYRAGNARCPICLTPFTESEARAGTTVTLEHVPPKAVGGSVMCLTCTKCNAHAGSTVDQAVALMDREMSGGGVKVALDVFGTKHTTYFLPDDDALQKRIANLSVRNPGVKDLQEQIKSDGRKTVLLTEITRGPTWDPSTGISVTPVRPQWDRVAVSWVRSAYLMVFSLLGKGGYKYAESESVRPIRNQLMNPAEDLEACSLWDLSSLSTSKNLIIMRRREDPACWLVKLDKIGVMLPKGGTAEKQLEVTELPDQVTMKRMNLVAWRPTKFGHQLSFELVLRDDSEHAGRELFGRELQIPVGEHEHRLVVANQEGLNATFLPIYSKRSRRKSAQS